jgi:Fe/S biogenesis protein NfuA
MSIETAAAEAELDEKVIEITDDALTKVLEIRSAEDHPDNLALRIEVVGASGTEYQYDLAFEELDQASDDDRRFNFSDLTVLIPSDSVDKMRGATLDLPAAAGQGGLVIRNPNRPNPLAGIGELTLEGDAADKVRQLLDEAINPSLASHGGFASLLGVEGTTAYVTMGGGCQGCSMSQATMVQGIATAVTESIPEITEVVDATDHSAGENPFYS